MASKIKESVLKEIRELANRYEKDNTKRVLLNNLYTQIKNYDDDKDIVNTVWANKDLPLRMFTEPELKKMPSLNTLLIGEPQMGLLGGEPKVVEKKLEKAFGKDWVSNFENIPYNQIALVAEKNGEDPDTLLYAMRDKATAKRREDIAHGRWDSSEPVYKNIANEIGGVALDLFGKRQQEAIERGESPSVKDYGIDIAESALQAVPYGIASKALTGPVKQAIVGAILSNAGAPFATEGLDALAYDEPNPRGKFSIKDAGLGTGVNLMGSALLRGAALGANRIGLKNNIMNWGTGNTRKEFMQDNLTKDLREVNNMKARNELFMERNAKDEALHTRMAGSNQKRLDAMTYEQQRDKLETRQDILEELDWRYNNNGARKAVYGKNNITERPSVLKDYNPNDYYDMGLTDEQLKFMANDPVLSKYLNIDIASNYPSMSKLMVEEGAKDLVTNKLGSYQQEQGKVWTKVPVVGSFIQKKLDEDEEEEIRRDRISNMLNRYKIDLLGGN